MRFGSSNKSRFCFPCRHWEWARSVSDRGPCLFESGPLRIFKVPQALSACMLWAVQGADTFVPALRPEDQAAGAEMGVRGKGSEAGPPG